MSIQLQQNLYSIYQLVLKLPKYILYAGLVLLMGIAISQLISINRNSGLANYSDCMMRYIIAKHNITANHTQQVVPVNESNIEENGTVKNSSVDNYELLDDRTLLNIDVGSSSQCSFSFGYNYTYDVDNLPFMVMTKNQKLVWVRSKPDKYIKYHRIKYDNLILPKMQISSPIFAYFYSQQMKKNQVAIQSFTKSLILLDIELTLYFQDSNITSKPPFSQLYLTYFQHIDESTYQRTVNLVQYATLRLFSSFVIKIVYAGLCLLTLCLFSIFIGLLIRYSVIFVYSLFLIVYDRCMADSWGWTHMYLSILGNRWRQNRSATFKFMVFYVISTLGMYFLLAFGSYCIIKKLFYSMVLLPSQIYTNFFFKTVFFTQLFVYIFCRSRTSLKYYPLLSFLVMYTTMIITAINGFKNVMMIMNLNFTLQLMLFIIFLLVEQSIQDEGSKGLIGDYCPSMSKPRMLYYAGYDISWEKTLPPIWTYFTNWFDYSHFNESEKSFIEKDYQLLYGRMLGLNERQQIPEYEFEEELQEGGRAGEQPSNEMNLIQGQQQ